ncbi:MAG: zinc dependent phospholipase C family protein [Clostridia bacterium]|nr:zinc dependent phospholipase C family protein [Clostridia bacterium]
MANWVSHLIIADRLLEKLPRLGRREFCAGSIAPDCNRETPDGKDFIPPRAVTHWMRGEKKCAADTRVFYEEYILARMDSIKTGEELSFLLGYYAHLIADAELQRTLTDEQRVAAVWKRAKEIPELREKGAGMDESWEAFKRLVPKEERNKDFFVIEREYLDTHPASGYFTEIRGLAHFPDYIDYLPENAIPEKIKRMYYIPSAEQGRYPFVAISREEYLDYLDRAETYSLQAIRPLAETEL